MTFRNQPLLILVFAIIVFFVTAVLPPAYMMVKFAAEVCSGNSITAVLIDSRQLVLLGRSMAIAVSATAIALAIGLPAAAALISLKPRIRKFFFFLILIPLLIPPYVMAGAWMHLFSPAGLINSALGFLFGHNAKLSLHSIAGCSWSLGVSFFPLVALVTATGFSNINTNLVDSARLVTGRWGTFWHSILPQIRPHLLASVSLVLIFVMGQYGVPSLLGINTYPVEIFAQFSAFYDDTAAFATSLPLIVVVVVLVLLQKRIMKHRDYIRIAPGSESANTETSATAAKYAAIFLVSLFCITTMIPLLSVFAYSCSISKIWTTLKSFSDCIVTTSIFALTASIVSTAIAFPIGYYLAHNKGRFAGLLDIICWLPIAIPGTIMGLGFIKLSNGTALLHINDGLGLWLILAYIGMFSAFSIRIFEAAHKRSDPNIIEIAVLDSAKWHQRLAHIEIPVHSGAIAASLALVFVFVVGELNATVLLIPPGKSTLSVAVDNLLHYGANATASALCLIEAAVVVTAVAVFLAVTSMAKRI